jgi:hypothetical protein
VTAAALEAMLEDEDLREIVSRMAALERRGRLRALTDRVWTDRELDPSTKAWVIAVAGHDGFLQAAGPRLDWKPPGD